MSDEQQKRTNPSSLLHKESIGGENAGKGFTFQDYLLISFLPKWLAQEGFDSCLKEGLGDIEAKFFVPGKAFVKELVESKDHYVARAKFFEELERFKNLAESSGGVYRWFRIASKGTSETLHPLRNGLGRIRNPYDFYADDEVIIAASYADYEKCVTDLNGSKEDASFIFNHVIIDDEHGGGVGIGDAMFQSALCKNIPAFKALNGEEIARIYNGLCVLVKGKLNTTISRREIEDTIIRAVPVTASLLGQQVHVHVKGHIEKVVDGSLVLNATHFSGSPSRIYPPSPAWEEGIVHPLQETLNWMRRARRQKRILLTGEKRLSASFAFGSVFSAVGCGMAVDEDVRGTVWSTDSHTNADTPPYDLRAQHPKFEASSLVVSIGIPRAIDASVDAFLAQSGRTGTAHLRLHGVQSIVSADQANLIVAQVKNHISSALQETKATKVELFLACPSFFALLLGHRWNALAVAQCYEWIGGNNYAPTCLIVSGL